MIDLDGITAKRCSRCQIVKEITDFSPRKVSKDGYKGICKACSAKYMRDLYHGRQKRVLNPPKEPLIGKTKVCYQCEQEKDYSEFKRRKQNLDGRDTRCKDCTRRAFIEYQARFNN